MKTRTLKALAKAGWACSYEDRGNLTVEHRGAKLSLMPFHQGALAFNVFETGAKDKWPPFTKRQVAALRSFLAAFDNR